MTADRDGRPAARRPALVSSRPAAGATPSRRTRRRTRTACAAVPSRRPASANVDRPHHLRAHREQIDVAARGVAQADEHRIVEGVGLGPLGGVGRERQVDELLRLTHRQRPEDQRVDQRERRDARAEGQRQRHHGGAGDDGVLAQHAHAEADVANHRIEPGQQLDVEALLAQPQRDCRTGALTCPTAASRVMPVAVSSRMRSSRWNWSSSSSSRSTRPPRNTFARRDHSDIAFDLPPYAPDRAPAGCRAADDC